MKILFFAYSQISEHVFSHFIAALTNGDGLIFHSQSQDLSHLQVTIRPQIQACASHQWQRSFSGPSIRPGNLRIKLIPIFFPYSWFSICEQFIHVKLALHLLDVGQKQLSVILKASKSPSGLTLGFDSKASFSNCFFTLLFSFWECDLMILL